MTGNVARNTKFILVFFGGIFLFGLLLLLTSHSRAKGRLEAGRKALVAAGEVLDIESLVPALAQGESNGADDLLDAAQAFSKIEPFLQPPSMRMLSHGRALLSSGVKVLPNQKSREWTTNVWVDLEPVIEPYREQALSAMAAVTNDRILVELDFAQGWNILLPHLSKFRNMTAWMGVAVSYDLRHEEFPSAYTNLLTASRITAKWRDGPFIIAQLVRQAMFRSLVAPLWELLQHDQWSDAQLEVLQRAWSEQEFWSGMERAFQMERATGLDTFERMLRDPNYMKGTGMDGYPKFVVKAAGEGIEELFRSPRKGMKKLFVEVPGLAAWPWITVYDDQLWYLEHSQHNIDAVRVGMRSNSVAAAKSVYAGKSPVTIPEHYWFSRKMLPALGKAIDRTGEIEAIRALCVTAIALKRFIRRNAGYPKDLKELVPDYLSQIPIDAMDGLPLRYRLEFDGRYSLWSIGKDGRDDGGDGSADIRLPDWSNCPDLLWPWPADPGEVEAYIVDLLRARVNGTPPGGPLVK